MVCGFGVSLSVKEQRVVGAARNRPVIFPRISIRYTPESDPADLILMLQKQPKDLLVPLGQLILNFGGKPVCIGIQFVPQLCTHLHIGSQIVKSGGQQIDLKLGHHHIYTQASKPCDGSFEVFKGGKIEGKVPLRPKPGDGCPLLLQRWHQADRPLSFLAQFEGVVVIVEFCTGVSLMCKFESAGQIILPDDLVPESLPQRAVIQKSLVDHIPAMDPPSVDRKSTRLNSSHVATSYAVFCLKQKID